MKWKWLTRSELSELPVSCREREGEGGRGGAGTICIRIYSSLQLCIMAIHSYISAYFSNASHASQCVIDPIMY